MPELVDLSELHLSDFGTKQNDVGTPNEIEDKIHQQIDGTKRLLEFFAGLRNKSARDAEEQRRRAAQPPAPKAPLRPVKAIANPPPQEGKPMPGDGPVPQGAPELAIPPGKTVLIDTEPQGPRPPVNGREPSPIVYDVLSPVPPDEVIDLVALPPPDLIAFADRLKKGQSEPGEPSPFHSAPTARRPAKVADPVDLFSGAFTVHAVDLTVPTPFIPIEMVRSYRSGVPYYGPFGYGWDHVYNVFLRPLNDGRFALWSGQLHEEHFSSEADGFEPRAGFCGRMERVTAIGDVFSIQFPGGTQWLFERPSGWSDVERIPLVTVRDRHGNALDLTYGTIDRVVSVLDDAGRGLLFHYGSCELLERVTDHTGLREVRYQHDPEVEHLVRVVLPATAQYPAGLAMSYEYASYHPHPAMRHNILRILDAEDRLMVENDYAGPDGGWEFNRLVRQRMSGFEFQFGYEQIQYVEPDENHVEVLASRTMVRPPDGSLHTYTFNYRGDLLDHRFRLNRDGSFRVVSCQWQHDSEGNVTETVGPDGLRTVYTFDSTNTNPCARRNLLRVERVSPLPAIVPSRITFKAQYDPLFQLPIRIEDESGAATRFQYDFDISPVGSSGRLRELVLPAVTAADGSSQQSVIGSEQNARGQLTATTTAEGCRTELRYLSSGLQDGFLSSVAQDPSGANLVSVFQYDAAGFTAEVESPGSRKSGFIHNALGQVEEFTSPVIAGMDSKLRRWFDDSGRVVRVERPAGSYLGLVSGTSIADEYERDEGGNIRRTIAGANTVDRREWLQRMDHEGRVAAIWDSLGVRREWDYAEDGSLLSETEAASETEARKLMYFYDRAGRLTRSIDANQGETKFAYDLWGRLHKITSPMGAVRTLEYGVNDRLIEERSEEIAGGKSVLRQRATYEYDQRGRRTFTTNFSFRDDPTTATALKSRFLLDKDDRLRELLLPRGGRYQYAFDTVGRLSEAIDLHGNVRRIKYALTGDLSEVTTIRVEGGATRTAIQEFQYDARGRLEQSTYLDAIAQFHYDDRNLQIERLAANGVTTRLQFNAHDQVIESIADPAGLSLRSKFEYDLNGHMHRYVDPMGMVTSWSRDALGRAKSMTPPDGTTWKYFFDDKARTTRQQTPAGNTAAFELTDVSGRVLKVTFTAAVGQSAVAPQEMAFDGLGRLVRASAGAESIHRQYDSLGRLIEETARGKTVRMEYDDAAGTADLIYPDGRRERTESNIAGQPTRIIVMTPGVLGGSAGDVLLEISYSSAGRPVRMEYGNGVEGQLVHDDHDRIVRVEYQAGGALLDSCRMRYDEHGHRALVQYLGAPSRNLVHRFDGAGRLVEARDGFSLAPLPDATAPSVEAADIVSARAAAAAAPGIAYLLDDADARSERKGFNGGAIGEKYVLDADHRVLAAGPDTITYNLDGHRKSDSRYIYDLDALNRVSRVRDRVTGAILVEQEYDPLSRVAAGSTDGQSFERWFAGATQIHEILGNAPGTARQHSEHPLWPSPFFVVDATGPSFIHQDEGWSTVCVTNATGAVLERHRYDVFGANTTFAPDGVTPLTSLRTEPVWRGMGALGTTKLFRTPQRLYDPETGVFSSRDPLLYADSSCPYAFAANNPVDFADPSGLAKAALGGNAPDSRKPMELRPLELTEGQKFRGEVEKLMAHKGPHGVFESIYNPIRDWLAPRPFKYLDRDGHVADANIRRDHMDAGVAIAQIISLRFPVPKAMKADALVGKASIVAESGALRVIETTPAALEATTPVVEAADPILDAATQLREGELFPPEFRNVRWRAGDPVTYPARGKYPSWSTVRRRIAVNAARAGNPLQLDPISPHRGSVPIDHIVPQRAHGLDPHNPAKLWICDDWGWLEHSFFDPFARGADITGARWLGPWE